MGEGSPGVPGAVGDPGSGAGAGEGSPGAGTSGMAGVTGALASDTGPCPTELMARTVKVYGTPFCSPEMVHLVAPVEVQTRAGEPDDVTVYPVIGDPPSAGAAQLMLAAPSPGVATTPVGALGTVGTTNADDAGDAGDCPAELVARAEQV